MQDKIEKLINENIQDAVCSFEGDACNLKLTVVSEVFKDLSLVNQHRKVLKLLEINSRHWLLPMMKILALPYKIGFLMQAMLVFLKCKIR